MQEWQAIETAPSDVRDILGYDDGTIIVLYWHQRFGGWRDHYDEYAGQWYPTHWMPVPAPPKMNKEITKK